MLGIPCQHRRIEKIGEGYPPFRSRWVAIERCRNCGMIIRTWDDLFVGPRPSGIPYEKSAVIDTSGRLMSGAELAKYGL